MERRKPKREVPDTMPDMVSGACAQALAEHTFFKPTFRRINRPERLASREVVERAKAEGQPGTRMDIRRSRFYVKPLGCPKACWQSETAERVRARNEGAAADGDCRRAGDGSSNEAQRSEKGRTPCPTISGAFAVGFF